MWEKRRKNGKKSEKALDTAFFACKLPETMRCIMKKTILILSAAACAVLSGCAAAVEQKLSIRTEEAGKSLRNVTKDGIIDPENLFTPNSGVEIVSAPAGKTAMITGTINELPFWTWLFSNDAPRVYAYFFSYIGKDGKEQKTPEQTRRAVPGTGVRFTAVLPPDVNEAVFHISYYKPTEQKEEQK